MKKVLFKVANLGFGGVERVQAEFVNYLQQNPNYQCTFVVENDLGVGNVLQPDNVKTVFMKTPELQADWWQAWQNKDKSLLHKIKYYWAEIKERQISKAKFNAVAKEIAPDIAINFHSDYRWYFKHLRHTKNIAWIHTSIVNIRRNYEKGLICLQKAAKYDKVVCVSKGIMNEAIELMPALTNKITYLYNPQDFDRIKLLANEEFTKEERQLAGEKFLLMVSRIDFIDKDFKTLIDAFDIAKKRGYDGKLYIIGGGNEPDTKQLLDLINAAKYTNEIKWLGAKSNPYKWMQACDKFVLSSYSEGFGLVLTEALAVNNTVISTNCKWGPIEILGDNEYGYLFPVGDTPQLGELMLTATGKAREKIDEHLEQFGRAAAIAQFEKILEG